MMKPTGAERLIGFAGRFGGFVAEQHPFALVEALDALDAVVANRSLRTEADFDALRPAFRHELSRRLESRPLPGGLPETTPRVPAEVRIEQAHRQLLEACDGFLRRAAIEASLTPDERRELLRGLLLTRATDTRLKTFFSGSEIKYANMAFQGKGFRSLGQEAVYAAALRLHRGSKYRAHGRWTGDVVGPVIRDVGVALAMRPEPGTVRMVLNAQMGKAGAP